MIDSFDQAVDAFDLEVEGKRGKVVLIRIWVSVSDMAHSVRIFVEVTRESRTWYPSPSTSYVADPLMLLPVIRPR